MILLFFYILAKSIIYSYKKKIKRKEKKRKYNLLFLFLQKNQSITYDLAMIYTILESLKRERERERYERLFSCLNLLKFERNGEKRKVEGWKR